MEMNNPWKGILEKYINEILEDKPVHISDPGPFISISRDFGCLAEPIAKKLAMELSRLTDKEGKTHEWTWINKEILNESSRVLGLKPSQIKYVFISGKKSMMEEVVGALSARYYKSDKKIRNTILEVMKKIASGGYVVIVGRGGVAFGLDVPLSLHIKLQAPLQWRIDRISENYNKSYDEALRHIHEVDKERKFLIDSFFGYETDLTIYDMVINRMVIPEDTIVQTILHLAVSKGLVK